MKVNISILILGLWCSTVGIAAELGDWTEALRVHHYQGQSALETTAGTADIITSDKVIVVAQVHQGASAITRAQGLAQATGKTAEVAYVIDGPKDTPEEYTHLKGQADRQGVSVVLANNIIEIERLMALPQRSNSSAKKADSKKNSPQQKSTPNTSPQAKESTPNIDAGQETGYWINTKSNIRHNKNCRYYGKGKNGKPTTASEGKACKVCGG